MPDLMHLPWPIYAVSGVLFLLALAFLFFFLIPAWRVGRGLSRVLKRLSGPDFKGPRDLSAAFKDHRKLSHLWAEFRKTLHEERVINAQSGVPEVLTLRATVPAETFFREDVLVDAPVRADFFRHLPGIFTGFGIIGTFSGLLIGLSAFHPTSDPATVQGSVVGLLTSVSEAFFVSAAAILLAMIVTLVEKTTLVRLHGGVQRITEAIDERFKAGVGEEYLSRLVDATEESASQSRILKDALVGDLKTILMEISDRQITAFSQSQIQLGQQISDSVSAQLKPSLERLASITEGVRGDQGAAVQQLIADLLSQFATRVEGLFGGQMAQVQAAQNQAIDALREAASQLGRMAATVEGAGQRASEALMQKLAETLHKLDHRQLVANEEMRKFVQEIRASVGESQAESQQQLQALLRDMGEHAGGLVGALTRSSQGAVDAISGQTEALAVKVSEASVQMAAVLQRLENVTTEAVQGMNSGAETLAIAADDFAKAGHGVTGALLQAQALATQMSQSAGSLSKATQLMDGLLSEYSATRAAITQMVGAVQATIETAKREASLTSDILQRLEAASSRLGAAQRAADEYLGSVTQVLGTSHQAFADSMKRTLDTGNREFIDAVSRTTKLLREAIQELEQTLGSFVPRPPNREK